MSRLTALLSLLAFASPSLADEAKKEVVPAGKCHTIFPSGKIENPIFLTQDASKKEAYLTVIATLTTYNYGMNFNGFAKGEAGYDIPVGWKVKVKFCNNSPVPHSIIVVEASEAKTKINLGEEPYFDGGMTPTPIKGTTSKVENFEFVVDEGGKFALACGFPTHSVNGHWIYLNVKKDLEAAAFVKPAKKKE